MLALAIGTVAVVAGLSTTLGDGNGSPSGGPDAGDLSLRELAGQRLVAGFGGERPPARLRRMIRRGELAGVVLFSDNFDDRREARRLIRGLQSIRRPRGLRDPLLAMVDQEGGLVKRLPGAPFASAAQMGRRGASFSRRQGRLTARNLARAGFNVDLAPVLDVGRAGGAIREEGRSFGATAARVSATGVRFAAALQAGGVQATAKHFPGLGAAEVNTDFGVERIELSKATLRSVDEAPFEGFIAGGGGLVMLSNAIYPAFSGRPAVFTRAIATGELRQRLEFTGVSVSDALEAAAARAFGGPAKVARSAARAGTDLLLFTDYRAAARAGAALRRGLRSRALPRPEFEHSAQRVLDLRAELRG
ncbi:MAG: glycoside hydrolase family 3 N-terminal domain-containing protein [Solirubrobacterales bacterium]